MSELTVDWWFYDGFHDGPLDGWIRTDGWYVYFTMIHEDEDTFERTYAVYQVPKHLRVKYLIRHRKFRHMVGWHCDARMPVKFKTYPKTGWKKFYDLPELPPLDLTQCSIFGATKDFKTISVPFTPELRFLSSSKTKWKEMPGMTKSWVAGNKTIFSNYGSFSISQNEVWIPAVFRTISAAARAFDFSDDQLRDLQKTANLRGDGLISDEDLDGLG